MPGLDADRVFWAHDIVGAADDSWMDEVAGLLTGEVYVTIDLDAFDPSLIPATGTPEPGGLEWYPVNRLLRRVVRASRVVGFDVVELLPAEGQHASAFAAAKLVYRFLAEIEAARDA
jgi:agmatinase